MNILVGLGRQTLAQAHYFTLLIGDFETDHGFTRNIFHHPQANNRQCAREIARESSDLAGLYARRRIDLKARDHRPRMHRYYLHLDIEIEQLLFYQARQGLQGFGGVRNFFCIRWIEQGQGRQCTAGGHIEQRHLFFALHALAFGRRLEHRLDARRRVLLHDLFFHRHGLTALALGTQTDKIIDPGGQVFTQAFAELQRPRTHHVHHLEPGQTGGQGNAREQQRKKKKRRTNKTKSRHQPGADRPT